MTDKTTTKRRTFLATTAAAIAMGAAALSAIGLSTLPAHAEWDPRRPVNVIVPYNAGGGTDLYARAIAAAAEKTLSVPIVVVNKPGAGGMTGAIEASKARPDGQTLLMTSSGSFLLRHMLQDTEVNPFDSFQTVAQVGNLTGALVVPADSPFKTVQDLADAAKADPGALRWAHNGRGGTFHVLGQTFLNAAGLEAVDVPFKGGSQSRAAVVGEQVDFGFMGGQLVTGFEEQMRVLAVADSERDPFQPDTPTFAEEGFDIPVISSPIIVFAPNGVDTAVVEGMEEAMKTIVETPEFADTLAPKGSAPAFRTGAEAQAFLRDMETDAQSVIDALK